MATLKSLSAFKTKLAGGGARPNLFEVNVEFPTTVNLGIQGDGTGQFDSENFRFLCKAAALPASNVAPIDVPFRGRILKVAGDRTFDTWTVTVINDENFQHRRVFEAWMQNISQYSDHSGLTSPGDYMSNAYVYQLGRGAGDGEIGGRIPTQESGTGTGGQAGILAQYKFFDIFPTNISQIDLSYDTTDTIEEFTVEFQVQYFAPQRPGDNSASG